MEEMAYKQWWPLHRRAAMGEPLSAEEQTRYEAGLRQLESEEPPIQSSIEALRQARQRMLHAQTQLHQLQKRYEEMQAEVAMREAQLDESTRQLLSAGK